jgi:hypothetical protein
LPRRQFRSLAEVIVISVLAGAADLDAALKLVDAVAANMKETVLLNNPKASNDATIFTST